MTKCDRCGEEKDIVLQWQLPTELIFFCQDCTNSLCLKLMRSFGTASVNVVIEHAKHKYEPDFRRIWK